MQSHAVIATKVRPPRVTARVARPRLEAHLRQGLSRPLTLVSAPPGWGKTTLAVTSLAHDGDGVPALAWVTLGDDENDPLRFWLHLAEGLAVPHPRAAAVLREALHTSPPAGPGTLATVLLNALARDPIELVVALDDYHVITQADIHAALTQLVEHAPPSVHALLLTRSDPPLPLARWRAKGLLHEVRAADLRFEHAEARDLLTASLDAPVEASVVATLMRRTDGWAAGLHLAALALRGHPDPVRFAERFSGSHRFVADYLLSEVLERQTADVQAFLRRTSVLDRLCGRLCDAVLGSEGGTHRQKLADLEGAGVFLVALDGEQEWYRYHQLFADLLRARLAQSEPDLQPVLWRRAADWCAGQGLVEEAVRYALRAGDQHRAADLVLGHGPPALRRGGVATARAWLSLLPDEVIAHRPDVAVLRGLAAALLGELGTVRAGAELLARAPEPSAWAHQGGVLQAYGRLHTGDTEHAQTLAEKALPHLAEDDPLRPLAEDVLGIVALRDADALTAAGRFEAALDLCRRSEHVAMAGLVVQDLVACELLLGRLRAAERACEEGLALSLRQGGSGSSLPAGHVHVSLAALLILRDELDTAAEHLRAASGIAEMGLYHGLALRVAVGMATLQAASGEPYDEQLRTAVRLARELPDTSQREFLGVLRIQLLLVTGEPIGPTSRAPAAAREWAARQAGHAATAPPHPPTVAAMTLARILVQDRATRTQGLELVEELIGAARATSMVGALVGLLTVQATALAANGNDRGARAALASALPMAESEGYVRPFLDKGPIMRRLLERARDSGSAYATFLLSRLPAEMPGGLTRQAHPAGLSERELQVLRLVAAGATNQMVADELVVTLGTVKKHLNTISGKLGTTNRIQAVARARALNLV